MINVTTRNERIEGADASLDEPPEFDLGYRLDEAGEEVTVFPHDPDAVSTEWLTIDAGFAVPVAETV